jgi:hypothetical protein
MAMQISAERSTKTQPLNTKDLRRVVAKKMIEAGKLPY